MTERIRTTDAIWGPVSFRDTDWSELATSAAVELSEDQRTEIQRHVNGYVAEAIGYHQSAPPKALATALGQTADVCKNASVEIWKLIGLHFKGEEIKQFRSLTKMDKNSQKYMMLRQNLEKMHYDKEMKIRALEYPFDSKGHKVNNKDIQNQEEVITYEIIKQKILDHEFLGLSQINALYILLQDVEERCNIEMKKIGITKGKSNNNFLNIFFQ